MDICVSIYGYMHIDISIYVKRLYSKAKQFRYTPWRRLGERRYNSYSFLTLALDRGEWSASRPGALCSEERTTGTHCTGGWVDLRAGLDIEVRGKIVYLCWESNHDRPVV
jgi:hypothetical protein